MMKNNFKKLEEDLISHYGEPPKKVKDSIDGTIGVFKVMGDVLELFIPRMLEMLTSLFSGPQVDNKDSKA